MASEKQDRIAFCGASGTGKTLLAKWLGEEYGLPINPVGCRSVIADMGLASAYEADSQGKEQEFQSRLVREKAAWEASHDTFVTDRTTFDSLTSSMLHDARRVDSQLFDLSCQGMARYQTVIYCPVSVFINVDDGDPSLHDLTYHRLYDATLWGLLQKFRPSDVRLVVMPFSPISHRKDFLVPLMRMH